MIYSFLQRFVGNTARRWYNRYAVVLVVLLFCQCMALQAVVSSRTANWRFCDRLSIAFDPNANYTFSSSYGVGAMEAKAGCASISSPGGSLLFYTDGEDIWDNTNTVMPNGGGLSGSNEAVQSSIIVPRPDNSSIYYVFYVSSGGTCYYSTVNMNDNGGNGDVVSGEKNVSLLTGVASSITACRHANGRDIWVVLHGSNNNTFYAFLITSAGLNTANLPAPQVSSTGKRFYSETIGYAKTENCMKLSPNGKYLATTHRKPNHSVAIYNFDNGTGTLAFRHETTNIQYAYGVEFSPDSKWIYATGYVMTNGADGHVYQIRVSDGTCTYSRNVGGCAIGSIQLAPDGRLYFIRNHLCPALAISIGVVNFPNEQGDKCGIVPARTAYYSSETDVENYSLPNFITSYLDPSEQEPSRCDECIDDVTFALQPWSTPQTVTPAYAHSQCGSGLAVTYQTRTCNGIKELRIIGIEIPCTNYTNCSLESLLNFLEDLILADIYPGLTVQPGVRVRFYIVPCWKKISCTSRNSVVWWICSQHSCCYHSYVLRADCYDRLERYDIQQGGGVTNTYELHSVDDRHDRIADGKTERVLDRPWCIPDNTEIEYESSCPDGESSGCRQELFCKRADWTPFRP